MVKPIVLIKPIRLEKKGAGQKFLELQPKLTPFLAATLAGITGGPGAARAAFTAGKTLLITGAASGLLAGSAKARAAAKERVKDPTKIGLELAKFVEDPGKLLPKEKPLKEKIKEVAKTAGLVGAAAAAGVGVVAVAKKKIKEIKIPKLPEIKAAELPAAILPSPPPSQILEPFGVAQPTPEPLPAVSAPAMPAISNKITFKPEINIKISKSRKFINQQLLIRK